MKIPKAKECRACSEEIKISAVKCQYCGSYQNLRRYLEFGNSTLALMIALISIFVVSSDKISFL